MSKRKKWLLTIYCLVLFAGALTVSGFLLQSGPKDKDVPAPAAKEPEVTPKDGVEYNVVANGVVCGKVLQHKLQSDRLLFIEVESNGKLYLFGIPPQARVVSHFPRLHHANLKVSAAWLVSHPNGNVAVGVSFGVVESVIFHPFDDTKDTPPPEGDKNEPDEP